MLIALSAWVLTVGWTQAVPAQLPEPVGSAPELPQPLPALAVQVDGQRKALEVQLGPVFLPANRRYADATVELHGAGVFPADAWLHGFQVVIVDKTGRPLAERMLHHLLVFTPDERDLISPVMRRIAAFGMESEAIRLPRPLGYRVRQGDSLLIAAALFNPTAEPLDSVFVRVRLAYEPARRTARRMAIVPFFLDAQVGSGPRVFDVPPGRWEFSREWSPDVPGRLLAAGAHLHQHGVAIVFEDVTAGKTLWRVTPRYDAAGEIAGIPAKVFRGGRGLRLVPGRVYRLTAIYDNPTDGVIRGAMGKIGGAFVPDPGWPLPAADRSHAEYRRDRARQMAHEHVHQHNEP